MGRVLNPAANAAIKTKGSSDERLYRRLAGRMGHFKAVWAVAHRLCRIAWKILHQGVRYGERGNALTPKRFGNEPANLSETYAHSATTC